MISASILALCLLRIAVADTEASPTLRADGSFKIVQIADLHHDGDSRSDAASDRVQCQVLDAEQPHLVVFSGDQVSGYAFKDRSAGWFEARWNRLTAPVRARKLPYVFVFGNHDAEADLTRRQIIDLDGRHNSLTKALYQHQNISGVSNGWLDIVTGETDGGLRIWLLDSMDRGCEGVRGWGCVGTDTVAWLAVQAQRLPRPRASLAVVHIPPPQFMAAWEMQPLSGRREEPVSCPSTDTGVFDVLRNAGVGMIISGHDHDNNFCGVHEGVRLCYGQKTGYGSYGPPRGWQRGARVLLYDFSSDNGPPVETWIRLEDGTLLDDAVETGLHGAQTTCNPGTDFCDTHSDAPSCASERAEL